MGAAEAEEPFYESIVGNFMVDHDRLETKLLQLFVHTGNSVYFSMTSFIIFDVDIVPERKQA